MSDPHGMNTGGLFWGEVSTLSQVTVERKGRVAAEQELGEIRAEVIMRTYFNLPLKKAWCI